MSNTPAVIIAAGSGSRIKTRHNQVPKTLLPVDSENRIIDLIIQSLRQADITEIIMVTGYKGSLLRRELGNGKSHNVAIRYVKNPRWKEPNGISVLAASQAVGDREFILVMSDHLFKAKTVSKLKSFPLSNGGAVVAIDRAIRQIHDIDDAMKLRTEQRGQHYLIKAIDKALRHYDSVDCGLFRGTPEMFGALKVANEKGRYSLSNGCEELIKMNKLLGCDITGDFWIDIDTTSALQVARESWKKDRFS